MSTRQTTPGFTVAALKEEAESLGFDAVGIAPVTTLPDYPHFLEWLEKGHAAGMSYLERHAKARENPASILEGVKSIIIVAMVYGRPEPAVPTSTQGRVARYARGCDYHTVLKVKLKALLGWLQREEPTLRGRAVVDTAPLLERDAARLAGLGWIGKNTMLIHKRLGSFTFLGALLVDVALPADVPFSADHCGTCTRCLDACPTNAFVAPYQLDARRCISYLTIEHRGAIPEAFASQLEEWVFGCDICQEVCPWNRKAPAGRVASLDPLAEWTNPDLLAWLNAPADVFAQALRGTALERAGRAGLLRNAALILGSRKVAAAGPALKRLCSDPDDGVQAAARWALAQMEATRPE